MAIGSHGRGRGGTVGDGRLGRRPTVEKLFSFLSPFGRAAVTIDLIYLAVTLTRYGRTLSSTIRLRFTDRISRSRGAPAALFVPSVYS